MFRFYQDCPARELGGGVTRRVLSHDGSMMIVSVQFEKGAVGAPHSHPHEQCCYCVRGRFLAMVDGQEYEMGPGDSHHCLPHVPHGVTALEDGELLDIFTPQREDFL